jgi:hypothetical protein
MKKVQQKPAPMGVKIISIILLIGAILMTLNFSLFVLVGILFLAGVDLGTESFKTLSDVGDTGTILFATIIFFFLLTIGIFSIFVARGLWKGKNWARISFIILNILFFVLLIYVFFLKAFYVGVISFLFLVILVNRYLIYDKKVKSFFKGV